MKNKKSINQLGILLSGLTLAATAIAAEGESLQSNNRVLEEVMVTAQKRSASVQDTPLSLSVISSTILNERGVRDAADLMFAVPSLQVGRQNGFSAITIRGVGRNEGTAGVALYTDGVYQPRAEMGDLAQLDLERVEVLRGPQGTVYGRNANGGVINFITSTPTEEFGGHIRAGIATFDEQRLQGVINVPVSEKFRSRLTVDWIDRNEGFVENVGNGPDIQDEETLNARLRVTGDLSDSFNYDVSLQAARGSGAASHFEVANQPNEAALASFPLLETANYVTEANKTSIDGKVDNDRTYDAFATTLNWDLNNNLSLRSISSYSDFKDDDFRDDDAIDLDTFQVRRIAKTKTFTQELNLLFSNNSNSFEGVVGAFYMDEDHDNNSVYPNIATGAGAGPLAPGSSLFFFSPSLTTESLSAFFDFTWSISDDFRLIGGMRYMEDTIEHTQEAGLIFASGNTFFTCPLQTNDQSFDELIPRVGAQYDLNDNSMLYGTYTEGFKSGGFNFFGCNAGFEPEEIAAYEVGLKSELLDGSLVLNLALFDYDYTNLQLRQVIGTSAFITNASGAQIEGLEVEAIWNANDSITVNAGLTLLDAKYNDYQNVDILNRALGNQDVSGNTLNNAPKTSLNLGLAYRTGAILAGGSITARLDASYRSDIYFREFNIAEDKQDAYSVYQAALVWNSGDEKYQVRLFGDNLTDEEYITFMTSNDILGTRLVNWGTPRQFGAEFTFNF